jgi:protein tyrosine/serine phosphatase
VTPSPLPRRVELDGPANFRDLGGYRTGAGREIRTGLVFRSDSLSAMTDRDVQHCVDELGIRTVVDLRAGHEVDRFSHGPLEAAGVEFRHRPIVDETRRDRIEESADAPPPSSPAAIYLLMLDRFAARLTDVVGLVADPTTHPVVFHCAAGKDRTGLVAALVLGLLDVDRETIVADYVFTADVMPLLLERHQAAAEALGRAPEVARQHFAADAEAMRGALGGLDERYGGIEPYLRAHGLPAESIATLRSTLVG